MAAIDKLQNLSDNKLIDIVKNYKHYGYTNEIKDESIKLLNQRGIDEEQLQLYGNASNKNFEYTEDLYRQFTKYSKLAFSAYLISLLVYIISMVGVATASIIAFLFPIMYIGIPVYLICLVLSFITQSRFYAQTNNKYGAEGAVAYFFLGMPFYIIMYFVFRKQMTEQLKGLR